MRVVLAVPPFDFSKSVRNIQKGSRKGVLPPLGVGYVGACLEQAGHEVILVDAMAEYLDVAGAAQAVAGHDPELVGVSALTTLSAEITYAFAQAVRDLLPDTPIVMGGPHVTSFAETVLQDCPAVDIAVPGDGEFVMAALADRIAAGASHEDVEGIIYRGPAGEPVATPPATPNKDLDTCPQPARHLYKHELYEPLPSVINRSPATTVITARGCPWARCRFCYQGGAHAIRYRRRSPENVIEELAALQRDYGIRGIVFWDDDFCLMPKWVDRFCDALDASGLDLSWSVLSRVSSIKPDLLKRMAKSGCWSIQFGFESGNQELLDLVDKGTTLDQARDAVRWAKEAGLSTVGTFILGFPTETPEMSKKTIQFACELNVDYVMFFPYGVAPGTRLEAVARENGTVLGYQGDAMSPGYLPEAYDSEDQLSEMVIAAYRRYYLRPRYIARALRRAAGNPRMLKHQCAGFFYWLGLMMKEGGKAPSRSTHATE